METVTATRAENAATFERVFTTSRFPRLSIGLDRGGTFSATTYWPSGDVCRDRFCCGSAATIDGAIAALAVKWEAAAAEGKKLRTAAECKAAVIDLIREHDAAPASFRDAVDALPVAP